MFQCVNVSRVRSEVEVLEMILFTLVLKLNRIINGDKYTPILLNNRTSKGCRIIWSQQSCFSTRFSPLPQRRKMFMRQRVTQRLGWPGNSLDIILIENLWVIVKKTLRKMDWTTTEMMICAVVSRNERNM